MATTTHNFPPLLNRRILDAAVGKKVDKIPVWIMRQAGRYLPEFQEIRKKHNFFDICRTPVLAAEVTLLPINRFDLDAAIIFSDILVIPQALGMAVDLIPGKGIFFEKPLKPEDLPTLKYPCDVNRTLGYVFEAITLTRHKLDGKVPLIGFSGAPWTLMCYMIEGESSKTMSKAKRWLYELPDASESLLNMLEVVVTDYLVGQVQAGAQMIQLFESNAEYLGKSTFLKYSLPYIKRIIENVTDALARKELQRVPTCIFAKGAHYALQELSLCGYDVVSIDWTVDPTSARKKTNGVTLQGNLDPCALYAKEADLKTATLEMVKKFGKNKYIANLGHGIYPDTSVESVKVFIDAVHSM